MATEEKGNTIHISGKAIAVIAILLLLLIGTFGMFALKNSSHDSSKTVSAQSSSNNEGIPEKCRLPARQEVNAWKEHLGHHVETQDCLKYFN